MAYEQAKAGATVNIALAPDYAVIALGGTIMLEYAEAVREQLRAVVVGGARQVLVDLGAIAEIDSRGLGALVSLVRLAQERGGSVRFYSPSPAVAAMLELTRVHRMLDVHPNPAMALSLPWTRLGTEHGQTA
jgi:anti-sigma B factor antagonist